MPAETRISVSEMPFFSRTSLGTEAWVIIAGISMRLSTPPRLSAVAKASFGTNLNYYLAHSEYAHGHCYSDLYLEPRLDTPYAYVIELKYCPKSSNEKDIDDLLAEARVQLPKYINDNHLQSAVKDKGWTLTGIIMVFNGWELTRYEVIEH